MADAVLEQNIKWAEPYVSKGLNKKLSGILPSGVYRGYNVESNSSVMKVAVKHDTGESVSVAVVERNGFNLTITMSTEGEVTIPSAGVWYICIEAYYAENQSGTQSIVTKNTPDSHHVVLAKVTVPADGSVITSDMIDTSCKRKADLITRVDLQDYMPKSGGTFSGVVKSPNPAAGTNDQTVPTTKWCNDAFVNVTGDIMSGNLEGSASAFVFKKTTNTGTIALAGGTQTSAPSVDGAAVIACGGGHSSAGQFILRSATSSADMKELRGKPDGSLTWDGQAIPCPTGTIIWVASATAPTGYLACNGGAVSRTTYAALFTAIGTNYGAGDGSTTFNLPNLINRVPWGGTPSTTSANNYKAAGVPDIMGCTDYYLGESSIDNPVGAFTHIDVSEVMFNLTALSGSGLVHAIKNEFYSSLGEHHGSIYRNDVYGKSDTVQPPACVLLPCIKI